MKPFLLLILLLSLDHAEAQFKLGLQAGYGLSKWNGRHIDGTSSYIYETKTLGGLSGGLVAEIKLSPEILIRPGIFLSEKGTEFNRVGGSDTSTQHIYLDYLEVPVSLMYKIYERSTFAAYLGGGAYFAYGFAGGQIGSGKSRGGSYGISNPIVYGNYNENQIHPIIVRQIDYGYILNSSVEWRRMQFLLSYVHGLHDLLPNPTLFNNNYRNSTLNVSIAYFIIH